MPLFELGSGRVRLVQPMQPRASTFAVEVRSLLGNHLSAIVPESLFVVREHDEREGSGLPDLLALDPSGRPVTVEVAHLLDHDALVAALRRAGYAARMTETDLAHLYHQGDSAKFSRDFAAFQAGLPYATQVPQRSGPHIIVLCADLAPEVQDVAGFWRAKGGRLDVFQVGVVRGEDERRLLVVAPYASHETRRRVVEPTGLRLVHGGVFDVVETTRAMPVVAAAPGEQHPAARHDLGDRPGSPSAAPAAAAPPAAYARAEYVSQGSLAPKATVAPQTTMAPQTTVASQVTPAPSSVAPPGTRPPQAVTSTAPARPVPAGRPVPTGRPEPSARPEQPVRSEQAARPEPPAPVESAWAPAPAAPVEMRAADFIETTQPRRGHEAPAGLWVTPSPATPEPPEPDLAVLRKYDMLAAPLGLPSQSGPISHVARPRSDAYPELLELAEEYDAPTSLVWRRLRRGEQLFATLRADGMIELPDGRVFDDPSKAAQAAAKTDGELDGWYSWRLGDGSTLAEAIEVMYQS